MANTTLPICGYEFLPINPINISSSIYTAFAVHTAFNIFTCPFAILLNILVIVAVKTKRRLRTKSNMALLCLATTDLVVGLVVQPLEIANFGLILKGGETRNMLCAVANVTKTVSATCISASLFHLLLMSGERYLAIKHSFECETGLVTEARIITASALAWMCAVIVSVIETSIFKGIRVLLTFVVISIVINFHIVIYKEVRRNAQKIIANQVSLKAKEKMLKNRRAFNTTVLVLLTVLLCYIPTYVWVIAFISLKEEISSNVGHIVFSLTASLLVLNSLLNPLIYTVRIRIFRVAFIQMLARKTFKQAEEIEQRIFGSNQIGAEKPDALEEDNKRTERKRETKVKQQDERGEEKKAI